jgi:hypothetical protein
MRNSTLVLISCGVGLLGGWGSAALFKPETPVPVRPQAVENAAAASKATRIASPVSRLDSVQACKDAIEAANHGDGRHPLLRRFEYERALRRWIELDPQGALAEAEAGSSASFGSDLFRAWVELDPKSALAALHRSNRTLLTQVAKDFFVALMARDPALAAAELKQPRWKEDGQRELLGWNFHKDVARAWMKSDPQAAIASLGPPGSLEKPDEAQRAILVEWAKTDFAAAWKHQLKEGAVQRDPNDVDEILAAGLLAGSKEALAVVTSLAAGIDPATEHPTRPFADTARWMADTDPCAALEWAESRPADDPLAREVLGYVARELASSDPMKALELLSQSRGSAADWQRDHIYRECFASLAAADPLKAREMIAALEPGERKDAMSGYLTRMFAVDEAGSIEQCRAWLANPEMKEACPEAFAVAFSWGHGAGVRDPGPVLEALPALGDAVNGYVLATWAKCDPEASAAWIEQRLAEGKQVKELEDKGVLAELAISEPEFTSRWVTRLANPKVQESAARILAANWASFDPDAAGQWVESLPEGALRDAAAAGIAREEPRAADPADPFSAAE